MTPPLSPRQAVQLEQEQIHRQLQLPALVSLADHDNIRASTTLRVIDRHQNVPISVEWTVPWGCTFFHIGVHNLPAEDAHTVMEDLHAFTARPSIAALPRLLDCLNESRDVLLVLNHPLWDEKGVGPTAHEGELVRLLDLVGGRIHALELTACAIGRKTRR